jgi:hypothetical protein
MLKDTADLCHVSISGSTVSIELIYAMLGKGGLSTTP